MNAMPANAALSCTVIVDSALPSVCMRQEDMMLLTNNVGNHRPLSHPLFTPVPLLHTAAEATPLDT